jgi:hypothetical protein
VFTDGQLQRPGQLHLHHHRRQGGSATATVIGGQPVDAPVANADIASTPINVAIGSIAVLANDT